MNRNSYCLPTLPKKQPEDNCKKPEPFIIDAGDFYLDAVSKTHAQNTFLTYQVGMRKFLDVLVQLGIDPCTDTVMILDESIFSSFISRQKELSASTETVYTTAVMGFYEYIYLEYQTSFDIAKISISKKWRSRRAPKKAISFPQKHIAEFIEKLNHYSPEGETKIDRLREVRDLCFLTLLAGTGFRVSEACRIRLGDIDFSNRTIQVQGKGSRIMRAYITRKLEKALITYLQARSLLNEDKHFVVGAENVFLFARHNINTKNKPANGALPISSDTGQAIVESWVNKILGSEFHGKITPHGFRHYFITQVYQKTKNLLLTKDLANHATVNSTERYVHLSPEDFEDIFDDDDTST
jgi:integrase/recombinase XerC